MPALRDQLDQLPTALHQEAVRLAYGIPSQPLTGLALDEQLSLQQRYSGELTQTELAAALGVSREHALELLTEAHAALCT